MSGVTPLTFLGTNLDCTLENFVYPTCNFFSLSCLFFIFFLLFYYFFPVCFVVKFCLELCMLGRRSLNLELLPLDPDIDRVFRKKCKTPVQAKVERRTTSEMGNNTEGNPNVNVEQPKVENVDYTRSLSDLFAPVAMKSASCIVFSTHQCHPLRSKTACHPTLALIPWFRPRKSLQPCKKVQRYLCYFQISELF